MDKKLANKKTNLSGRIEHFNYIWERVWRYLRFFWVFGYNFLVFWSLEAEADNERELKMSKLGEGWYLIIESKK